jgi:hypothetical protein
LQVRVYKDSLELLGATLELLGELELEACSSLELPGVSSLELLSSTTSSEEEDSGSLAISSFILCV